MEATDFRCPTCGSRALTPNPDGSLTCARCGGVCEPASRVCPDCGAANPPEVERCIACGCLLNLVDLILEARLVPPGRRLEQAKLQAETVKEELEAASQERLQRWWEEEAERRRAMARAQMERDRQERQLILGAVIFAVLVMAAILIYVAVTATGPGTPTPTPVPL